MEEKQYTIAELHLHTAESSRCGKVPAAESIPYYKEIGFDLVCVTDHFNERYFPPDCTDSEWRDEVTKWMAGWYAAREAGKKCGMTVLHGVEIQLTGHTCEFLVYGLDEKDFLERPRMYDMTVEELSALAKQKGLFISLAHPFRKEDRPDPSLYDGAEVFNRSESFHSDGRRDDTRNDLSAAFAAEHGLIPTCGQDFHEWGQYKGIKTRFYGEVRDMGTLIAKLRAREFDLILPDGIIRPAK